VYEFTVCINILRVVAQFLVSNNTDLKNAIDPIDQSSRTSQSLLSSDSAPSSEISIGKV